MAVVGFVLGILAMVVSYLGVYTLNSNDISLTLPIIVEAAGLVMAVVGLILSVKARKSLRAAGKSTGLATAGLVVGIIATVVCAIMFVSCVLCSSGLQSLANA